MNIEDIDLQQVIEDLTGQKFNRQMKISSPFSAVDKTPSFSIYYNPNRGKWLWTDFSADCSGDVIDFVMQYKGIDYPEARKFLGLEVEKNVVETELEKVEKFIEWSIKNQEFRKDFKLLGIFPYTDENNKVQYYKAKFRKPDGKKELAYFYIDADCKVKNKRGLEYELPYNLYNTLKGIEENKTVVLVEGEKDVNKLNSILGYGYIAASIKNCKAEGIKLLRKTGMKIIVIPDNDDPGIKYSNFIYDNFYDIAKSYKIVKLPYIGLIGKGADATDWLENGHSKKELFDTFNRTLDLKDEYELQQNAKGVYKTLFKETRDGITKKRIQLTDFVILDAKRLIYKDSDIEGIYLKLKSSTGTIMEKQGPTTVFDDTKTFRNFLGSLDLSFKGKIDDIIDLKMWINKYFATENETIYPGATLTKINDKLTFIGKDMAINIDGTVNGLKAESTEISLADRKEISKNELKELCSRLFEFASKDKTIPIIGTIINNLMVDCCIENNILLHHLLLVGESGSGKSAILTNVIAPILGLSATDIKSLGECTNAAITKEESLGNYPLIFDEYKPSTFNDYKNQFLSNFLRNVYGRTKGEKGHKDMTNRVFTKNRPWIFAGEESYFNNETANTERSCIAYLGKGVKERTDKNTEAFEWLKNNQDIVRKFGFSILKVILDLDYNLYLDIRAMEEEQFTKLKDRPKNTAVNIAAGIEIFNILLERNGLVPIKNYEHYIIKNIDEEILDGGERSKSIVEQMLIYYNEMIENGRASEYWDTEVIVWKENTLCIKTSEMINQIAAFANYTKVAEFKPLKLKDFKKQAKKAGYLTGMSSKQVHINGRNVRFDEYDAQMINLLDLNMFMQGCTDKTLKLVK